MSRILVLYGTTEGHTARIARAVADTLRAGGAEVDVAEASAASPRPQEYDGIIVAASVHGGAYQRPVHGWVQAHAAALNQKPTAFLSVCLGVLQREDKVQREVAATIDRFLAATSWRPAMRKPVAGALLYTKYNWITRWMMKRIARQAGGDTDTSRDFEYTDWADLRAFAEEFGRSVAAAGPARVA